jgi:uncharacterized protein YndB with AHSA1/START domain
MDATQTLAVTRHIEIQAPATAVFNALTDAREVVLWWGDDEIYRVTEMDHDLRVGGHWRVVGKFREGREFSGIGVYREIDAPRVIEHTRRYVPGVPFDYDTVVRFELDERDGRTHVGVVQSGFQTEEARDQHGDGWDRFLGWLNDYLSHD